MSTESARCRIAVSPHELWIGECPLPMEELLGVRFCPGLPNPSEYTIYVLTLGGMGRLGQKVLLQVTLTAQRAHELATLLLSRLKVSFCLEAQVLRMGKETMSLSFQREEDCQFFYDVIRPHFFANQLVTRAKTVIQFPKHKADAGPDDPWETLNKRVWGRFGRLMREAGNVVAPDDVEDPTIGYFNADYLLFYDREDVDDSGMARISAQPDPETQEHCLEPLPDCPDVETARAGMASRIAAMREWLDEFPMFRPTWEKALALLDDYYRQGWPGNGCEYEVMWNLVHSDPLQNVPKDCLEGLRREWQRWRRLACALEETLPNPLSLPESPD